jgi:hypothetical protein
MVPVESFAMAVRKGPPRMYRVGKAVLSTDPAVKKHPHKFVVLEEQVARKGVTAHTATAAPGEVRQDEPVSDEDVEDAGIEVDGD